MGTINVLLAEYGLEKIDLATSKAEEEHGHIRERLDSTRSILPKIQDNAVAQSLAVRNIQSMLVGLIQVITGEFKTSWASLTNRVASIWYVTVYVQLKEMV